MKHRVAGRKLGRRSSHRLALLRNLATALFERERIKTTLMKAKELRPFAEKLVTMAKKETLHARRQVLRHVHDRDVVAKLFETLSARFAQRPGGYTRIIKLGPRRGDAAEMAIIELVGSETLTSKKKKGAAKAKGGKPAPEAEAAEPAEGAAAEGKPAEKATRKQASAKKTKEAKPKAKDSGKSKEKPKAGAKPAKKGGKGSSE